MRANRPLPVSNSFSKATLRFISDPWFLFFLFASQSFLFSYSAISQGTKVRLFEWGFLLPLGLMILRNLFSAPGIVQPFSKEVIPRPPAVFWLLLSFLAIFLRFYKLTSLSLWPLNDEGLFASTALGLSENWDWKFFYSDFHLLPLTFWTLGGFFKFLSPSLLTLWAYPAALSTLSVLAGYAGARQFFTRSFSLIFGVLMALGFWPLYASRFCNDFALLLFWELLAFWGTGLLTQKAGPTPSLWKVVALGGWVGAGFYITFSWPLVALFIAVILWRSFHGKFLRTLFPFGLAVAIPLLPLLWSLSKGSPTYIRSLLAPDLFHWNEQLFQSVFYVTNLFWTNRAHLSGYGPYWGGFLNPLLTAAFFLGVLELIRRRREPISRFLLFALPLCWLPAFVTANLEMFRILHALPLVLAVVTFGLLSLLQSLTKERSWKVLAIILLFSAGLDAYHLFGPYQRTWAQVNDWSFKSAEGFKAFRALQQEAEKKGPGFLLTDLGGFEEGTDLLNFACHSFDCQNNAHLPADQAHWVAVITEANLEPFLQKRFPSSKWVWLSEGVSKLDGGLSLGFFPLDPTTRAELGGWIQADRDFLSIDFQGDHREQPVKPEESQLALGRVQSLVAKDPFIASCYWRMRFLGEKKAPLSEVSILENGLKQGYPSAFFYFYLGGAYYTQGKIKDTEKAWNGAVKAEGNKTSASFYLKKLDLRTGRLTNPN